MRPIHIILIVLFLFPGLMCHGQRWKMKRYKLSIGVGGTSYFGDIGGAASENNMFGLYDVDLESVRPNFHLSCGYKMYEKLHAKINLNYGMLRGSDVRSLNEQRAFSFKTTYFEPTVQMNYVFLQFHLRPTSSRIFNRRGMLNDFSKLEMFFSTSLGYLFFNPVLQHDRIPKLQLPDYRKSTFIIPIGGGVNYLVSNNLEIGLELARRMTFSDYLDGYSSRFSEFNDIYYVGLFILHYRIKANRRGLPDVRFK